MGGLAFWVSPYMPYKYPFLPPPLNAIVLLLSAVGQLFLGCLSSSSEQARILFLWLLALLCCSRYFALYSGGPEFIDLHFYCDPFGLQLFFVPFFVLFWERLSVTILLHFFLLLLSEAVWHVPRPLPNPFSPSVWRNSVA